MSCQGSSSQCLPPTASLLFFEGTKGATGPSGAIGPMGATGPNGGPSGPAGATGATGPAGNAGATGSIGIAGSAGPAIVFRGPYDGTKRYYDNSVRRDIVSYGGTYYLTNNAGKDGNVTWGLPSGVDWTGFGAQFESVATNLLLANNATILYTLTLGNGGANTGILESANYVPGTSGFYMDYSGFSEFQNIKIRGAMSTAGKLYNNTYPATAKQFVATTFGTVYGTKTWTAGAGYSSGAITPLTIYCPGNANFGVTGQQGNPDATGNLKIGINARLDSFVAGSVHAITIYYRINGGTPVPISSNADEFTSGTVIQTGFRQIPCALTDKVDIYVWPGDAAGALAANSTAFYALEITSFNW